MQDLYSLTKPELFEHLKSIGGGFVILRTVGGVGDAVMAMPAVTAVKQQAGDLPVIASCIHYVESIFRHNPSIDGMFTYTEQEIGQGMDLRDVKILENIGCVVYKLKYPCPASIYENQVNPSIIVSRQAIFCDACDVKFNGGGYNVKLTEEDLGVPRALGLNSRYIVVHLKSHDYWRDYPPILMKALLSKLVRWGKEYDIEIATIDSTLDYGVKGVQFFHHKHLDTIYGLLNGAMMLIGPDSAMVHMAGALGVNVLGIFGPTDPEVRLKYPKAHWVDKFSRCKRQYCWYSPCSKKYCLRTLRPSTILQKAERILSEENMI